MHKYNKGESYIFSLFNSAKKTTVSRQQEEKLLSNPDIRKIVDSIISVSNAHKEQFKDRTAKHSNSIYYGVVVTHSSVRWGAVDLDRHGIMLSTDPDTWWSKVGDEYPWRGDSTVYFSSIGIKDLNAAQVDLFLDVIEHQMSEKTAIRLTKRYTYAPTMKMIYADITCWAKSASSLKSLI